MNYEKKEALMEQLKAKTSSLNLRMICMDEEDGVIYDLLSTLDLLFSIRKYVISDDTYFFNLIKAIDYFLKNNNKHPEIKKEIELCMELIKQKQKEL